jgi:NADPH:quinone reductase-like Zn-dependent oxidoreductase
MKAVYIEKHGGPEVLEYGDLPDPVAKPGGIIVDIHAASVNGADWKVRAGKSYRVSEFPYVLGRDFSGVVSALGEGVRDFKVGDPEKIAINAAIVAKKPDDISDADAAALALAGLTALVSIEDTIKLKPGETILIQGGAGGVANFAVQLAKHIGARVITTGRRENHDYLRSIGADEIIDYTTTDFTKVVSNVDAVFETVGGAVADKSFEVIRPGGRAAFIGSGPQAPPSPRPDVRSLRPDVKRDRPHLERIVQLVESGAVRPPEITIYPLAEAIAAHKVSEGRHLRGKLVFKVR